MNQKLLSYLNDNGIVSETSVPYKKTGNSHAERAIRTIKERSKTLFNGMEIKLPIFNEAIKTSVYYLNRQPRKHLNWKTPNSFWNLKPDNRPKYEFGAKAIVLDRVPSNKSNTRGKVCHFAGCHQDSNFYIMFDPITKKSFRADKIKVYQNLKSNIQNVTLPTIPPKFYQADSSSDTESEISSVHADDPPILKDVLVEKPASFSDFDNLNSVHADQNALNPSVNAQLINDDQPSITDSSVYLDLTNGLDSTIVKQNDHNQLINFSNENSNENLNFLRLNPL